MALPQNVAVAVAAAAAGGGASASVSSGGDTKAISTIDPSNVSLSSAGTATKQEVSTATTDDNNNNNNNNSKNSPLDSMKDLDEALDNIISCNLPKGSSNTNKVYTRISQKIATTPGATQERENPVPLQSLSKEIKEKKLQEITPQALNLNNHVNTSGVKAAVVLCKFIQCVLWDAGFQHTLLSYQFDAVLASAGIDVKALLDVLAKWDGKMQALLVCLNERGKVARVDFCRDVVTFVGTKGLLLADGMGLGKTIEAIGAALLRDFVYKVQEEKTNLPSLPTLIVVPSDAFVNQWKNALVYSGVPSETVALFVRDIEVDTLQNEDKPFLLMSKHSLMTEMRHFLKGRGSVLFPNIPEELTNLFLDTRTRGGNVEEITDALGAFSKMSYPKLFRTLIIDECHTLRNLITYGGIGAALLGIAAGRVVPMTCTPFINTTGDLATLMVFIDPTMAAAHKKWWKEATKQETSKSSIDAVSLWKKFYLIRRDQEVLRDHLPKRSEAVRSVQCFEPELRVYKRYEQSFISTLGGYLNSSDPGLTLGKKDLTDILLLYLINMRMSLIHPLIPKGRDFTLRFSPSRRHLEAQLSQSLCVCCCGDNSTNLVPLPSNICHATSSPSRHFAHDTCLKILERAECVNCPRCKDLESRSCMDSSVSGNIYCKSVKVIPGISGFKSTAKIEKILEWVTSLPNNSKAIIFSFFEGALDLLEGALTEDYDIDCARHDNDISADKQAIDLTRFKTSPDCKILLATVQSCGSGLNIEEANHIAFVDRWFDVTIHEQAISRCHNIKQTKDVNVVYFDAAITVDEIMRTINESKSEHASITLADGTIIGAQQRSIRYQDVSGPIYDMIKSIANERKQIDTSNPGSPSVSSTKSFSEYNIDASAEKKQHGRNVSISPPSILKSQSFGLTSSNKSGHGARERRVAFAPLPNDMANFTPHSASNNDAMQQQQLLHPQNPHQFHIMTNNYSMNGSTYPQIPYTYSNAHGVPLTPSQFNYGYPMMINPFLDQRYYMQGMAQEGYRAVQQPPPLNHPFHGEETGEMHYSNFLSENVNPTQRHKPLPYRIFRIDNSVEQIKR